jgi:Fur family peroxide stress response transcriptional regulator
MKHETGTEERIEKMLAGVRAAGLKLTAQRIAIVRELANDESHPTAQNLFDRLRPRLPTMSFATVYNTLDALAAAGLCAPLQLTTGSSRFDPNMAPHDHAVCDRCGAVRDIPAHAEADDAAERRSQGTMVRAVRKVAPGFRVRSVEQIFRGLCSACADR